MAITVWPAELVWSPQVDTTNANAVALIAAGTGLFISNDNRTTVINAVDGSAGLATDITNNQQGVDLGGFSAGYDTSSLTAEQQSELAADPFQVFQTVEDDLREYGLKLTTPSESLTLTGIVGAWTGTEYNADGTSSAISGSGNYVVDGTTIRHITRIDIADDNGLHIIDLNRLPGEQPVDLGPSNTALMAALSGFPTEHTTSGFVPVVPRVEFTTGAGQDYADFEVFRNAQRSNSNYVVAQHYGAQTATNFDLETGDWPAGLEYSGVTADAAILNTNHATVRIASGYHENILFSDIQIGEFAANSSSEGLKDIAGLGSKVTFRNVKTGNVSSPAATLIDTFCVAENGSLVECASFLNSVAIGTRTTANNYAVTNAHCENSIALLLNNDSKPAFLNCTGDFNVADDNTAPGINSQQNVDFTNAFVNDDPAQGITQAWADQHLLGQGWNGSDIAAWAVVSGGGESIELQAPFAATATATLSEPEAISVAATFAATATAQLGEPATLNLTAPFTAAASATLNEPDSITVEAPLAATATAALTEPAAIDLTAPLSASATATLAEPDSIVLSAPFTATATVEFDQGENISVSAPFTAIATVTLEDPPSIALQASLNATATATLSEPDAIELLAPFEARAVVTLINQSEIIVSAPFTATATVTLAEPEQIALSAPLGATATALLSEPQSIELMANMTAQATAQLSEPDWFTLFAPANMWATVTFEGEALPPIPTINLVGKLHEIYLEGRYRD